MRNSSIFAIFCLAVGIAPLFAVPSGVHVSGSNRQVQQQLGSIYAWERKDWLPVSSANIELFNIRTQLGNEMAMFGEDTTRHPRLIAELRQYLKKSAQHMDTLKNLQKKRPTEEVKKLLEEEVVFRKRAWGKLREYTAKPKLKLREYTAKPKLKWV